MLRRVLVYVVRTTLHMAILAGLVALVIAIVAVAH